MTLYLTTDKVPLLRRTHLGGASIGAWLYYETDLSIDADQRVLLGDPETSAYEQSKGPMFPVKSGGYDNFYVSGTLVDENSPECSLKLVTA